MITAISTAIATFIATNLDDILILTILFTQVNKLFRRRHIVIGQYLGFILLILASLTGFFGSFLILDSVDRFSGAVASDFSIRSLWRRREKPRRIIIWRRR
jgi:cadmium resistance protein CadD (predicted permease)